MDNMLDILRNRNQLAIEDAKREIRVWQPWQNCRRHFTNAIGLGIIGQDFHKLNTSSTQRNSVFQMLVNKTVDEIKIMLEDAVLSICREIGMTPENEQDYLISATEGFASRVFEAIKHQDISNIFISFDSNTNVND